LPFLLVLQILNVGALAAIVVANGDTVEQGMTIAALVANQALAPARPAHLLLLGPALEDPSTLTFMPLGIVHYPTPAITVIVEPLLLLPMVKLIAPSTPFLNLVSLPTTPYFSPEAHYHTVNGMVQIVARAILSMVRPVHQR
jgi:pyruvate/2-oxoglutarate dehydrogenase complex dihydrolipoamide acyltransferase (E2) component